MKEFVMHQVPPKGGVWASYCRVSTPGQIESNIVQRDLNRRYVDAAQGALRYELSDVGTGSRVKNRPGYQKLLNLIRERKITHIVARDLSRFGRRIRHLYHLMELCTENGVLVYDTQMGQITDMHIWAVGIVAQMQLQVLSLQIKEALVARLIKGLRTGGRVFGYDNVEIDGEKGHLVKNEDEAAIVQLMYNLADEGGLDDRAITRTLNRKRIPAPGGGRWHRKTVAYILTNAVYRKDLVWNKCKTYFDADDEKLKREPRPEEQWLKRLGQHDPIIDADQIDRVQAKRNGRKKPRPITKKTGPAVFLSGKLKCAHCTKLDEDGIPRGGTMSVCGGDGRATRLRCSYYSDDKDKCSNNRTHYRHEVLTAVLQSLVQQLETPEAVAIFLEEHNLASRTNRKKKGAHRAKLSRDLQKLEAQIKRLAASIADGAPNTAIIPHIVQRENEKQKLSDQLADLDFEDVEFEIEPASVERYLDMAKGMLDRLTKSPTDALDIEVAECLEAMIDYVLVSPNPEGRGFSVEVFGKLAQLVADNSSHKADFRKGFERTDRRQTGSSPSGETAQATKQSGDQPGRIASLRVLGDCIHAVIASATNSLS
ncbi:recombinase family protein [Bradyrhizobium sp. CCGB01]|uniref:recombinase family protein n=1 Tax=Bradyrhizobium sp. CCGB01 TaxID=2949634 RepID=UPI0020B337C2|nr:recombinase family protein [Bradyrhizobium sp. CCGB01]MCP3404447.1 recombinase family protein [Bradyrhizobium sp. CCGB01]